MEILEHALSVIITMSVHILEFMGVATILCGAFRAVYDIFRRNPGVRLKLAESMALALEFKLGGEILRTVQVRDWSEIAVVGAIILLRGVLNLLIHHEIKIEEDRDERIKALTNEPHTHIIQGRAESCLIFPTPDIERTADWYVHNLGFRAEKHMDSAQRHICLCREGMEIMLTDSGDSPVRPNRELYGCGYDGCFITDAHEELAREFTARGVSLLRPSATDNCGEFVVEDIDGRHLYFGCKS